MDAIKSMQKWRDIQSNRLADLARSEEYSHHPQAPLESIQGQDPLTDWGLGVRERTLHPLNALAKYSQQFQNLTPEEMGMQLVGGGMAGTFIGKGAKTWKAAMKDTAENLEKNGVSPEDIWKQTGTFRGADKEWRQEIPDNTAMYRGTQKGSYADEVIHHPELFATYPQLGSARIQEISGSGGMYTPHPMGGTGTIQIGMEGAPTSTGLHELQHAIQEREGWASGGSPEGMRNDALDMLRRDVASGEIGSTEQAMAMLPMAQQNAYKRLAGEAEARLTQARMSMTPAQRAKIYPPSMFDILMSNQIIRKD